MAHDFLNEYFIKPIISPEIQGYNAINTTIFILLLVIACVIIYLSLRKKIEFNHKFFISIIPYIIFGISLRVIMHQVESGSLMIEGITKTTNPLEIGFWFFTPGIWLLTFGLVVIGLLISRVQEKLDNKKLFWFGLIVAIIPLMFNLSRFNNWLVFIATAILIVTVAHSLSYLINRFTRYKILQDKMNMFIIFGQAMDGIATSVAISYFNFSEQHVVSKIILDMNPTLFIGIKLLIAILICWSLDDYLKDYSKTHYSNQTKVEQRKNAINFIKVVLAILGFSTGLASLFKLGII